MGAVTPVVVVAPPKLRDRSSGAEKSELSKVDMDTHSSKYDNASSVRRFDIFFLSLLLCSGNTRTKIVSILVRCQNIMAQKAHNSF